MPNASSDLLSNVDPSFAHKALAAIETIRAATKRRKNPVVAYSGGKDSTVVLALVEAVCPHVIVSWSDDELEYPETVEIQRHVQMAYGDQYVATLGRAEHAGWFRPWQDRSYWRDPLPGTIDTRGDQNAWLADHRGCDILFLGTRAAESRKRDMWLRHAGPTYRVKDAIGYRCCPIWDWTDDDVWQLIEIEGLPVNGVYRRLTEIGVHRTAQRVGPLPLSPRAHLVDGWPDLLERLEARYGRRWD